MDSQLCRCFCEDGFSTKKRTDSHRGKKDKGRRERRTKIYVEVDEEEALQEKKGGIWARGVPDWD